VGLPGGGVEQGEHPDDAVIREFREETGLDVRISGLNEVTADVSRLPGTGSEHTDRIIYDVVPYSGDLRNETAGTTDLVGWAGPAELDAWPLMPFTARLLGRPVDDAPFPNEPDVPRPATPPACSVSARTRWPPTRTAASCSPRSRTDIRAPAAGTCPAAAPITARRRYRRWPAS
jgi:ADP-ribose pyrophosphatase YjhB (NUDIX family)